MNANIIKSRNTLIAILVGINIFYLLFIGILNLFLRLLLLDGMEKFIPVIRLAFVLGLVIIDVVFLAKKILPMSKLASVTPIKCRLENFVIESYKRDGKMEYRVHPLVRDIITNEMYFTFGDYNISSYKVVYSAKSSMNVSMRVLRKDKTDVNIGDSCLLYIYKPLQVKVDILEDGKYVKLNKDKILLNPINPSINVDVFNQTKYFAGVVDFNKMDS